MKHVVMSCLNVCRQFVLNCGLSAFSLSGISFPSYPYLGCVWPIYTLCVEVHPYGCQMSEMGYLPVLTNSPYFSAQCSCPYGCLGHSQVFPNFLGDLFFAAQTSHVALRVVLLLLQLFSQCWGPRCVPARLAAKCWKGLI